MAAWKRAHIRRMGRDRTGRMAGTTASAVRTLKPDRVSTPINPNTLASVVFGPRHGRRKQSRSWHIHVLHIYVRAAIDFSSSASSISTDPRLELQPQSLSGELNQWRHLSACRDEIVHQFAAADLVLSERDRRHKVIHLEVLDKGVTGIEPTRRPQQSVALKSQLFRTLAHCSASRAMAVRTLVRTRLSGCQIPAAAKQLSGSRCR